MQPRLVAFVAIVLVALGAAGGYLAWRLTAAPTDAPATSSSVISTAPATSRLAPIATSPDVTVRPGEPPVHLLFRRTSRDAQAGMLGFASLDEPSAVSAVETLRCERVHMAAGRGVCLVANWGVLTTFSARVFDATFTPSISVPLVGVPSRVQVSPDGRLAGITVFVAGHSYADAGFSTRASVLDLSTGAWVIEDFEALSVWDGERPWKSVDFNFWGITFARDSRTFYATLGTGGATVLVKGEVGSGRAVVVERQVECPSLSPDNQRVAFKQRVGTGLGPMRWQIAVLDLASGERHTLAETRNVDDQVQWLDDTTVMYALPAEGRPGEMNTWVVPADGSGTPRLLVGQAYSAGVIR